MIKNEEIGGIELEFSIKFNQNDDREYLDKATELQDRIEDLIEELGHSFIVGSGKPILKSELD